MSDPVLLGADEARRIALTAAGLDRARPRGTPDEAAVRGVIDALGLLQIDYVNVLVPAQYQVLFSRLGGYDRAVLDRLAWERRGYVEFWAHEASIVPVEAWPHLRHRFGGDRRVHWVERFRRGNPALMQRVLEQVRARGALAAAEFDDPTATKRTGGFWGWSPAKCAFEGHIVQGTMAVARRRDAMERVYDLSERVLPAAVLGTQAARADSMRALVRTAARVLGVATAHDLADYYRLAMGDARAAIAALQADGELVPVRVEGWKDPAWRWHLARAGKRAAARTLLSPFDPLIWFRPRVQRLFGVDYRLEIWVPRAKRKFGYYVLPFLLGDRLVARVDLACDRAAGRLQVVAAYAEPGSGASLDEVSAALAVELRAWAAWLGMAEGVAVARKGTLARALGAAMKAG